MAFMKRVQSRMPMAMHPLDVQRRDSGVTAPKVSERDALLALLKAKMTEPRNGTKPPTAKRAGAR